MAERINPSMLFPDVDWSKVTHVSLHTGQLPRERVGLRYNPTKRNEMPDAPEVTITEITGSIEVERNFDYGEGELTCQGPGCSAVIGYHLAIDYETDMDREAFTPYWEIVVKWPAGPRMTDSPPDVARFCEDDWGWLTDIAPALIAFRGES